MDQGNTAYTPQPDPPAGAQRLRIEEYRSLLESNLIGILLLDADTGQLLSANPALLRQFGYTRAELTALTVYDVVHPEAAHTISQRRAEILQNEMVFELPLRHKDGHTIPSYIAARAFTGEGQTLILAQIYDMSEARQAEASLRESEERLRTLIETTPDVICLKDGEGRWLIANQAELKLFNLEEIDYRGKTSRELFGQQEVYAGIIQTCEQSDEAAWKAGQTVRGEEIIHHADGSVTVLDVLKSPVFYPDGRRKRLVVLGHDLTSRKQIEDNLRRRADELATLQSISLNIVSTSDLPSLLQEIVEQTTRLLNANSGGFYLIDPERRQLVCAVSYRTCKDYRGIILNYGEGAAGWVAETGQPLIINDYSTWENKTGIYAEDETLHAIISAPVIWKGSSIGVIHAMRTTPGHEFSQSELDLLTLFANQSAAAIANVHLLEAERRRRQEAETLRQAAISLASSLNLKDVLDSILVQLEAVVKFDSATIFLLRGDHLYGTACKGFSHPENVVGQRFPAGNALFQEVLFTRRSMILSKVQNDPRFIGWGDTAYVRSWMGIPLIFMGGVIGYLTCDSRQENAYVPADAELAETFANHAAVAIENALLFESQRAARVQAETLREVAQVLNSSLELKTVIRLILEQLKRILTFDTSSFLLLSENNKTDLIVGIGYQDESSTSRAATHLLESSPILKQMSQDLQPVRCGDVRHLPGWIWVPGADHVRSFLCVPVIARQKMMGALMVDNSQCDFFSESDTQAAQALAQHMAVAIENARLYEAERSQLLLAHTLQEVGALLTSQMGLSDVLEKILDLLGRVLKYDSISIHLLDREGKLKLAAGRGFPSIEIASGFVFAASDTLMSTRWQSPQPTVIPDTSKDPSWFHFSGMAHIRSWVGAPLLVRGRFIGCLNVDSKEANTYQPEVADTVIAFANQAAIAIENARLFEAEHIARTRSEALREASQVIASTLSMEQVFQRVLEQLLRVVPYDTGNIMLVEGSQARIHAAHGYEQFCADPRLDEISFDIATNLSVGEVIRSQQVVVFPDVRSDPRWVIYPASKHIGSWMGVPLHIRNQVIGVFSLDRVRTGGFYPDEVELAQSFAANVAAAIENARLFEQSSTERRHLRLLYNMGRQLPASLDPNEIFDMAILLTSQALGGMIGQAYTYLPDETRLRLDALYGRPKVVLNEIRQTLVMRLGEGLAGSVAQARCPALINDVTQDPRWRHVPGLDDEVRSAICAPIQSGERLLGVITVLHHQLAAFNEDHLNLLEAICQQVGLALSNAGRYQQLQRQLTEILLIQKLAQTFTQRLELDDLLTEVVTQLGERLNYPQVEIYLMEESELVLRAYYGTRPSHDRLGTDEGVIGRVTRSGEPALLTDVSQDQDYIPCLPDITAEMVVPIFRGRLVIGVINIQTCWADQINQQDLNILQVLAGQISIALENAVLYARVRSHAENLEAVVAQRTAELTELYRLSQEISYQPSYESLLDLLLRHLRSAVRGQVVLGCILVEDPPHLMLHTARPLDGPLVEQIKQEWLNLLERYSLRSNRIDLSQNGVEISLVEPQTNDASPLTSLSSLIHAPIFIEGRLAGLLLAGSQEAGAFGGEQLRLLTTFANQAAAAIQRLQALLAAQQKHLASLVEHVPVGTILFDEGFNLLVANPLGVELLKVINEQETSTHLEHLGGLPLDELIRHQNDPLPLEIVLPGTPQHIFSAQIRLVGGLSRDEKRQWVLTLRETTRERESLVRIQSQERLATVGQLAAGIAHDFNNIMATILVYADLLRQDPNIPLASREKLSIIQQQVQRASSLIRQILDFSRRSVMDQSALDLLPFLKELDKMLARIMPETIHLELTYHPSLYWVNADPTRLQQVFMNLALNARDAMPDGGTLHFDLADFHLEPGQAAPLPELPPGDWVRITVADSGMGIPGEIRLHLFEPFYTTKPVGRGTGLGLAQVYGIIKQHDGFIEVQSEAGQGTKFVIYLPALKVSPEVDKELDSGARLLGQGETVLLVEDDPATRAALQVLLETHNYRVLTAENGVDALRLYEAAEAIISLVVSDIVMPQMGGIELYNILRARRPDLKMLFITGHPLEDASRTLLEGGLRQTGMPGGLHWLQKPFSVQEFNQAIYNLLRGE